VPHELEIIDVILARDADLAAELASRHVVENVERLAKSAV
jgi:DNA-binding GntR family transcriptional regulator